MREKWIARKCGIKGNIAIALEGRPESAGRIATIPFYEGREGQQKKNADMISAAPELFALLAAWFEWYEYGDDNEDLVTPEMIRETISALKKARGEA